MAATNAHKGLVKSLVTIIAGSLIFAVGLDCFEIPNGLAAGGAAGLATILSAVLARQGIAVPVGMLVLAMNAFLLIPVYRSGGMRYAVRTVTGIVASAVLTDVLAPYLPVLGNGDLLLCAMWGGVVCGFGVGLIFRAGGGTGGTDVLAQFIAKRTSFSVGSASMAVDMAVVALSVLVFGLEHALYAAVCLYIGSHMVDMVVDGAKAQRAAYILSRHCDEIAERIFLETAHPSTRLVQDRGEKGTRPMLLTVVSRSELSLIREIVLDCDPHANIIVSSVSETFGEGFADWDDE